VPKYSAIMPEYFRYTFPLYIFLLAQVALSIFDPVPFAEPLWSIGVEEQFYLIWPVVTRYAKKFLRVSIIVIVFALVIKQLAFMGAEANRAQAGLKYWNYLLNYLYFTRIECMAVGGIGAWLVFSRRENILKLIFHRGFQLALYGVTVYLLVSERFKPAYHYFFYAVCFCLIILNIAVNPRSLIKMENKAFIFLGNISFSIYMFHEIVIKIVMGSLTRISAVRFDTASSNLLLYGLSIALTILVSAASYYGFERLFLRIKSSFAVIESGQDLIERGARLTPDKAAT